METYPFNVLPFFSEPAFSGTVRSWENSLVLHHFGGAVMKYNFNKVQDRIGSDSIKWEKQLKFGTRTGLLPFWIADTDFATLPEAVEAMKKRLEHPVFGYTTTGERTLETVRGWYKRRHQVDLPVSAFSPSEGVVTSIWFSIRGFTQPGDGVLVFTPV